MSSELSCNQFSQVSIGNDHTSDDTQSHVFSHLVVDIVRNDPEYGTVFHTHFWLALFYDTSSHWECIHFVQLEWNQFDELDLRCSSEGHFWMFIQGPSSHSMSWGHSLASWYGQQGRGTWMQWPKPQLLSICSTSPLKELRILWPRLVYDYWDNACRDQTYVRRSLRLEDIRQFMDSQQSHHLSLVGGHNSAFELVLVGMTDSLSRSTDFAL